MDESRRQFYKGDKVFDSGTGIVGTIVEFAGQQGNVFDWVLIEWRGWFGIKRQRWVRGLLIYQLFTDAEVTKGKHLDNEKHEQPTDPKPEPAPAPLPVPDDANPGGNPGSGGH